LGDQLARLNRDRALFNPNARRKMVETIATANPEDVARVIVKALEIQIVTEEYCHSNGVEPTPEDLARFHKEHFTEIEEQLERTISGFVGGIVSQEG
jgi:hypothetical protein